MSKSTITEVNENNLANRWEDVKNNNPGIRIREAARRLHVTEAVLLASTVGENCVRLEGDWKKFLKRLPELGRVMSLTRNESCILEHKGSFEEVKTFGKDDHAMAIVIGFIETRVFFKNWHVAFAVKQEKKGKELISLQVFDKAGDAITKIYLQESANFEAYERIVNDFRSPDQTPEQAVTEIPGKTYATRIDENAFLEDWRKLRDTHDYFGLLNKYDLHRHHAMTIAEGEFTRRIALSSTIQLLNEASGSKLPIMIFAGNNGNLQIHQGPVRTIRILDRGHLGNEKWLNVLDPEFNLHMRQDHIKSAWVVKKPTNDGIVTSVEVFDENQELIARFFGLRKPGNKELEEWRELVDRLPDFTG